MINDLSYIMIPFDKTREEFQTLISKLKQLLKFQSGGVNYFELIEGIMRMNIDGGMVNIIRTQIEEGNFSRSAYDISICLFFFGRLYESNGSKRDLQIYQGLLKDLKHMRMADLRC
jgi:hypothetical protein